MLFNLLTISVLIIVLSGWGSLLGLIPMFRAERFSLQVLNGFLALALLFTLISFLCPLSFAIDMSLAAAGAAAFFGFKNQEEIFSFEHKAEAGLIFAIIAFAGSFSPCILDHFGYYEPSILWLREAGLIRGIANLDLVLGQMSAWHILSAGISHAIDPFLKLNISVLAIYAVYALEQRRFFHFLVIPVLLLFVQSPSPDLPAIAFSLIVLNEYLAGNRNIAWLFTISSFIFIIKPTVIWPMIFIFFLKFSFKNYLQFLPGAGILLLFILKNYWCFGYPVFPIAVRNIGLPWAPNSQLLSASADFAIMKTYDMHYSAEEIRHFTLWQHIIRWITIPGIKALINIFFIIILAALSFFALKTHKKSTKILIVCILFKCAVVLITSAQYRFFIDVFFAAGFIFFAEKLKSKKIYFFGVATSCLVGAALTVPNMLQKAIPSFRPGHYMQKFNAGQMIQPSEYEPTAYKTCTVGNLTFNAPDHYPFCYKTPLPAISPFSLHSYLKAGIFPQYDGPGKRGFIWKKLSAADRNKLQSFLTGISRTSGR